MNSSSDLKKEIEELKLELKKAEEALENTPENLDLKSPKPKRNKKK